MTEISAKAGNYTINGIPTDLIIQPFEDYIFICINQLGTFGTVMEGGVSNSNGRINCDIQIRLGRRDDPLLLVYCRQLIEHFGSAFGKRIALACSLKDRSPSTFENIMNNLFTIAIQNPKLE